MILRVPDYYRKFSCIAGKCKHSCCIGWEIDIDEDTLAYYRSIPGAFGERLKSHMQEEEEDVVSFALGNNGRCPFLNKENLCDICIELGEEALSEVCTEYPRFVTEYGNVREKSMALSCEEVGRLMFEEKTPFSWEEMEIPDFPEDPDCDPVWYEPLEKARDFAVRLCREGVCSLEERLSAILEFGQEIQESIREEQDDQIKKTVLSWETLLKENKPLPKADTERLIRNLEERLAMYKDLEILDEEWEGMFQKVETAFGREEHSGFYQESLKKFQKCMTGREWEYEKLLAYFLFRYTMQTVYDYNFMSHMCYGAASVLMVRDMDLIRFLEKGETFTMEDRIDTARIYSREVEHSEENLEMLQEAFQFRG